MKTKIPADEGGGYSVCIPSLGRKAFIADRDTVEEVLNNLEALKQEFLMRMLKNNITISLPRSEKPNPNHTSGSL